MKGRFHQRAEGLDEYMRQLQQGAEIRPCIELEKVGNDRWGEEGGEPGDAHQRLTPLLTLLARLRVLRRRRGGKVVYAKTTSSSPIGGIALFMAVPIISYFNR
jgi:hypothetical protein